MKNIKLFKYKNTYNFEKFLKEYGYTPDNVVGFSFNHKEQYRGNVLKQYVIFFNDGEYEYFKVLYFKSFNEYKQTFLGFNGNRLLEWYENANLMWYKWADKVIRVKYH